jgi:hypothetical protein
MILNDNIVAHRSIKIHKLTKFYAYKKRNMLFKFLVYEIRTVFVRNEIIQVSTVL